MEGPQEQCSEIRERMNQLLAEQSRAHPSGWVTSAFTHPRTEMVVCVDGLHYRATPGTG
jgi:hypothetical protein